MSTTRIRRRLRAPRAVVYRALLDGASVQAWRVPAGMSSRVHAFDAREGGAFRVSLTYETAAGAGKTSERTDTYRGRFVELVPNERVVEEVEFETDEPSMRGPMRITTTLADADGGTELVAVHEGLPPGVPPADNERGWSESLARLAALVEGRSTAADWPPLRYAEWEPTCAVLHAWTQIVGKVRLARTPWINHSWQATLYLTARGLTTSTIPYGARTFQIDFDFVDDALRVATSDGGVATVALAPSSVADFYARFRAALHELDVDVAAHGRPNEVPTAIPFAEDTAPRPYDADAVRRFWRALLLVERVFVRFRSGFLGKVSPVHLFWGGLDLAVTRFSGRRAPTHPGGAPNLPKAVNVEAYSHEVSSAGFWAGGAGADDASFYSYAYPEPKGFRDAAVSPADARYDAKLGMFVLPYASVRAAADPETTLLAFLQSSYDAAADLGRWDRAELDCPIGEPRVPRPVR